MITEAGKEYIAREFGIGDCWIYTGLSWVVYGIDGTTVSETGGTGKIVSRVISGATDRVVKNAKTYRKADLTSANEGNEVTLIDVRDVILVNDGYPAGEDQYCIGVPPTKGYLKVNTSPTGATVTVGATSCGTTPVLACELSTGWKTVTIAKPPDYQTETRTVEIIAGATSDLGTIYLTPVTGEMGWFSLCTYPAGATIKIDGVTIPWLAPLCPLEARKYEVTANVKHTVEFTLADYKPYLTSDKEVAIGGTTQIHVILEKEAGPNTGTLLLKAHDSKTGQELHARPSIDGTTVEEKFLTPYQINLAIPATKTEKEYKVGAYHPGYAEKEQYALLKTSHTEASPLVVDLALEAVIIWKEVAIVEEMPSVAWVTGLSIPPVMAWGLRYTGWLKFFFTKSARYRAFLEFYAKPEGWNGTIGSLPANYTDRISMGPTDVIDPWVEESKYELTWTWDVPSTIPEGLYIVVSVLEWEG